MKIQQSSDTSGLTLVSLISEELESVFEKMEKNIHNVILRCSLFFDASLMSIKGPQA